MDTQTLLAQLRNPEGDDRWRATQQLATLGARAVDDLLQYLTDTPLDEQLRQCSLYVFEHQWDRATLARLKPVIDALHGFAFRAEVPVAAAKALQAPASH